MFSAIEKSFFRRRRNEQTLIMMNITLIRNDTKNRESLATLSLGTLSYSVGNSKTAHFNEKNAADWLHFPVCRHTIVWGDYGTLHTHTIYLR